MNLSIFLEATADGDMLWWQSLASGLKWTLATAALAWILAFVIGSVVGVVRTTSRPWLVRLGNAYVELFRNIPLLVQMFLWYFVLPELVPSAWGLWLKQLPNAPFYNAVVCLGFYMSARVAEQVRAGVNSLPRGQKMAGTALGLTTAQTYRYVLLPMAYRIVIPPLTSESMNIIKNSSVAFAVSVSELTMFAMQAQEETARGVEIYLAVTVLYFVSAFAVNRLALLVERRMAIPGTAATGARKA